jgi:type IV pilus assembly protein PilV
MSQKTRGFTVVELLMALAIFAISATGVLALQVVSSRANTHAKDLAAATQVARSWQDKLAMDALLWGGPNNLLIGQTEWIQLVQLQDNQWILPPNDAADTFGPAADARGAYVDGIDPTAVYFCTHIRLTRLFNAPGSGLLRSEVRVFWPKGYQAWNNGAPYCNAGANVINIGAATAEFNFVYHTTTIRETPAF